MSSHCDTHKRRDRAPTGVGPLLIIDVVIAAFLIFTASNGLAAGADMPARELGALTGSVWAGHSAINDRGDTVGGAAFEIAGGNEYKPFLWTRSRGYTLFLGDTRGVAIDINDNGQIIGETQNRVDGETRNFRWGERSGFVDLGAFQPIAINGPGAIVGRCDLALCLWRDGTMHIIEVGDAYWAVAADINDSAEVTGTAFLKSMTGALAFVWSERAGIRWLLPRGAKQSYGRRINNNGVVVGEVSEEREFFDSYTAVWSRDGAVKTDLMRPSVAAGVDDEGVVALNEYDAADGTPTACSGWLTDDGSQSRLAPRTAPLLTWRIAARFSGLCVRRPVARR